MKKSVDVVYVVASKLGSIGMGITSYNALMGLENSKLSYKCFSRGYDSKINLKKNNLTNYSLLEYLSYPFRFVEKILKIRINSFRLVNYLFGKLVFLNLPKTKIYHSWIGVSPDAIKKAKNSGAILILEGANSHPMNVLKILKEEYKKFNLDYPAVEEKELINQTRIVKKFDYVMCPSKFVYDSYLENGFSKEKLILLPYGVELDKFKSVKKNKSDNKFRLIFVGSVQLRKGIQYLLKAWEELKLKDAELIIVGRTWPDAVKVVEKYKDNPTIRFEGFNSSPIKLLQQSDVFISPSLEEGSALTCYEAMACGLPIIATYNTGSIARDGKDGFIIPAKDEKALKEKINYLYENSKICKSMGINAKKYVKNFDWTDYGNKLASFYKKLIKNGQR